MASTKMIDSRKRLTDLLDPNFMNRLDSLDVMSRKILQGKLQGERRSKRRGQSVEFADHRPYVPGDDLRFVDWNIYGRLERLFLKLYLEEQDLTVHIMADASGSMTIGEPSKELFIKKLTAALGSNLNKDEVVFVPGYYINFTLRAAVVGFKDVIALFFEEIPGQFFTEDAGISTFHFSSMSLTGRKDWRWMGDGPSLFRQARCFFVP